jgi:two-component system sensor kinase FixL
MKNRVKKSAERIPDLEHAAELLHASEEKYRYLVENADCIILRMDTRGAISFFNEFAQKFFGFSEREILGKKVVGTIVPKTDPAGRKVADMARGIRLDPERYTTCETESIHKDGRRGWVVWANKAIRNERQQVTEILCVGHDITERKRMENELRLLAAVVRNSHDAITVQDFEGTIISWNRGAERMYGYGKAEALKMNVSRLIPGHKRDKMRAVIERLKKGDKIESFETLRLTKEGRTLDISLTAALLRDPAGKPFAVTTTERDMTERRHLEKEILEITERERKMIGQEMHDSMGQVLTGVAVKSKGLALKLKGKSLPESKGALAISRLASQAIAQMRDLARMLYPVDIEAGGLVSALQMLASNAEKILDVRCRFLCDKPVSVNTMVEAKQLYRIAQEAVTNAAKHGKAKTITIELSSTEELCILSVKNDGLDFQNPSRTTNGLGLKIMEYRANLIGGVLDIRKGNKHGTVVTCTVPNQSDSSEERTGH